MLIPSNLSTYALVFNYKNDLLVKENRLVADIENMPYTDIVKSQKVSVAQGIEQQPPKLWVAGSIPAWDVLKPL